MKGRVLLPTNPHNRGVPKGIVAVLVAAAISLTGCTTLLEGQRPPTQAELVIPRAQPTELPSLPEQQARNLNRYVHPDYPQHPVVVDDSNGIATSSFFFDSAVNVIVSQDKDAELLRAASLAVFTHAPLLTYSEATHGEVIAEIQRLRASRVLLVGDVGIAEISGEVRVMQDPGTLAGLGDLTAHRFMEAPVADPRDAVAAVAALDGGTPTVLTAQWDTVTTWPREVAAFPVGPRRDAQQAPVVVATAESGLAAVATARSFGAEVRVVPSSDPRVSSLTLAAMAGLSNEPLIALGSHFGTDISLANAIKSAEDSAATTNR